MRVNNMHQYHCKIIWLLYLTNRNLSMIIFYSHFNNYSGYSRCVKIATFYFLTTNTLPHYFSTRCQIPLCHNIRIFQLHQNLQFTVYYCFLCWPLVHRHAICSTFYFFSGSILSYYTYSSYYWPLTDIDSNANWCNCNFYGFPCHLPNNNLSVICFL